MSKKKKKTSINIYRHSEESNFNWQIIYTHIDFQSNSISKVYDQSSVKFLSYQIIVFARHSIGSSLLVVWRRGYKNKSVALLYREEKGAPG